ncbi:MAG: M23 family metallopeptidase [Desulfuromonadales bacterium]
MRLSLLTLVFLIMVSGCQPSTGVYHTVKKGQTLYRISNAYNLNEHYLARINGVDDPKALQVGKRLFVPGAKQTIDISPAVSTPTRGNSSATASLPDKIKSAPPADKRETTEPSARSSDESSIGKPPEPDKGQFVWPIRGEVLKDFCKTGKEPCKGIEIAAEDGTPVLASSAGKVIYSGDGIRGYGNLLIIKHDKEFFSVYGYNKKNLVDSGAFVSKGQQIALSGTPPGGGESRLHFEIRHGRGSVDPALYLP